MNNPPMQHLRGQRRFWNPVEGRYFLYSRPEHIDAVCNRCGCEVAFRADKLPTHVYDESSGGYASVRGQIGGQIVGRGACTNCGRIVRSISWPESAFFKVQVPEGVVWAWNVSYVPLLRARVAGDKVALRHLVERDWDQARFVSRLPRYAVLTKNRHRILAALDRFAEDGAA
jgi:hypothetical protein